MKMILNDSIHLVAQPQTSIGKKFIASLLEQYLTEIGDVKLFFIQTKDISLWDNIFSPFFENTRSNFIIAVKSSCIIEFMKYLTEIKFFKTALSSDTFLFNHFIFSPGRHGEQLKETLNFLSDTLDRIPGNNVVWENDNLGTTIYDCTNGQYSRLQDFPEYTQLSKNIYSTVYLPAESYYFQKDLSKHIINGQTFDQAIYSPENNLIYRQRLYQIKKRIFEAIKNGINRT